jgi:KUP system potassium uptake protein
VAKIKERWMFLFFELFIFPGDVYLVLKPAKSITGFTRFVDLGKFAPTIKELSEDDAVFLNFPLT